ncbi:DSBA-like thioredoxin domain-containing protein [Xylariaceae sp. FL0594]|nr:DSBA-like thioredoxin domain-containing protein [Xylariaceae sp. FL0594]
MTNFNIKIVSDTVCPWCYIGKKRLDRAIELYRSTYPAGTDDTFTISWFPFYLDPSSPAVGIPVQERMVSKFGAERYEMIRQRLTAAGRGEGISFSFAGKAGNTRDSHRLIQLGKTKGTEVENRVVAELFRSYFEGEGDITSHATLVEAAERAGLDVAEAREWLESGKGGEEVDREVQRAYANDIHGVPNFTIQDKYDIGGAQEPEVFLEAFTRVKKAEQ